MSGKYKYNPHSNKLDRVLSRAEVEDMLWLLPPVEEEWDVTAGLPVAPADGDRYLADGTGGGWTDGYIYEWDDDEGVWIETVPEEGMLVWLIFEMLFWVFFSGGWMEVGEDSYLNLDQTTPQDVDNGAPSFNGGIIIKSGEKLVFDG